MELKKKGTILAVDDEEDILELVRYNLEKEGYIIHTATSGKDAVRIIKKTPPDLIILDLMLPGMDGLDVCKVLKNNPTTKQIPIIMLTAKGDESDIVLGLSWVRMIISPNHSAPRFYGLA